MSYLLDTNVLSELVKAKPNDAVVKWVNQRDNATFFISVLTLGEIRRGVAGIRDTARYDVISHWLEFELPRYFDDRVLPIDQKVADMWGRLQSQSKGQPLPAIDALIAATAMVHQLTLVTRNVKDFVGVSLDIINPWEYL